MDRKRSGRIGTQKWKIKGGRGRHRELEISAPIEEVTLGGLQHDWGWVSDGVLETGQGEPFVPAAATFQSATDIYTPALIERLACEPSACARTHTLSCSFCLPLEALLSQTQPQNSFWPLAQKGQTCCVCYGKHPTRPNLHLLEMIQLKVEFRICLILTSSVWEEAWHKYYLFGTF